MNHHSCHSQNGDLAVRKYASIVLGTLALSACAPIRSNQLFRTIAYADLAGMSSNQLAGAQIQLEKRNEATRREVTGGKLSFLSPEELRDYNRDVIIWKILTIRMSIALDERVGAKMKKPVRPADSATLDGLFNGLEAAKMVPEDPGENESPP